MIAAAVVLAVAGAGTPAFAAPPAHASSVALQPATAWSSWATLGGAVSGGVDAGRRGDGTVDLVARGTNNMLYTRSLSGGAWSAWRGLGGVLSADPAVASMNAGRVDIAVRGSNGAVYVITERSGVWGGWVDAGGVIVGSPDLTSGADGRLDLVGEGTDRAVWHRTYLAASGWGRWERLGGATDAAPTVTASAARIDVVVHGTDDALYAMSGVPGGAWTGWTDLGGWVASGPDAGTPGAGQVDVVVRGFDRNLYRRTLRAGAWTGWETIADDGVADPATVSTSATAATLFSIGTDESVRVASTTALPPTGDQNIIVRTATAIMNGHAEPGWAGGPVHYSYAGGHAATPGPSRGSSGAVGLDCSGFTRWVYSIAFGSDVLHGGGTNNEILLMTKTTTPAPGDLAFYGVSRTNTHHVGVYIGGGLIINALHTGTDVRTDPVTVGGDLLGYWHLAR